MLLLLLRSLRFHRQKGRPKGTCSQLSWRLFTTALSWLCLHRLRPLCCRRNQVRVGEVAAVLLLLEVPSAVSQAVLALLLVPAAALQATTEEPSAQQP